MCIRITRFSIPKGLKRKPTWPFKGMYTIWKYQPMCRETGQIVSMHELAHMHHGIRFDYADMIGAWLPESTDPIYGYMGYTSKRLARRHGIGDYLIKVMVRKDDIIGYTPRLDGYTIVQFRTGFVATIEATTESTDGNRVSVMSPLMATKSRRIRSGIRDEITTGRDEYNE